MFTKPGDARLRVWPMNGTAAGTARFFDITPGHRLAAARDFDGDGLIDLMWTNADRRLEYWRNTGNMTFAIVPTQLQYAPGWRIVGSGDFNNDNKADLAFIDDNALLLSAATVWTMDGGGRIGTQSVSGPVLELLHSPVAVDRYGGATASMMWTSVLRDMWMSLNDGTGENYTTTSVLAYPASSSGSFYRNYPAGWTVFTAAPRL